MKIELAGIIAASLLLGPGIAWTQEEGSDEEEADTTIRLMGAAEAEVPAVVTDLIVLPENAADDNEGQNGIDQANLNRVRREEGLLTADDAREQGAEIAEDAMDNQESRGRSEDRPEPPENPGPPQ